MSLADYLAKNYLSSGSETKKSKNKDDKKRKKKAETVLSSNLIVHDDGFGVHTKRIKNDARGDNQIGIDDDAEVTDIPILKSIPKPSGWKIVGTDEIVNKLPLKEERESTPRMQSGAKAGLQTGAEVAEQIRLKREKELKYLQENSADLLGKNSETIHRDKSGRIIDINAKLKEDELRKEREKKAHEQRLKDLNMGLIQKLELEEQKLKLNKSKDVGITKYANDEELNAELKQKELEDDPLLAFKPTKTSKYVSKTGRKLYQSGFPENRFNIVPGHRWDGVDRSNGFEKAWFKKQAEVQRKEKLSYTMQEDY
ncbi:hypothetical protein WICMUC_003938 [Wickerhamomyces mucosus]|uniref:Pre-mRNA-splicing factor CWC26 n=1 Tax=Wickerhamomyces mucosus TaxID=1378264 RepID=A0A9P8TC31_9ASCO|nr:hypothetical protein WICMUC_003938 [Wickerhamomyces mucosus]